MLAYDYKHEDVRFEVDGPIVGCVPRALEFGQVSPPEIIFIIRWHKIGAARAKIDPKKMREDGFKNIS